LQRDDDGMLVLPQRPGFGLELDEAAVAKYAVT
jgi:L-alanine-DL-glutamate epimerase-like enolase superfamily enzyme